MQKPGYRIVYNCSGNGTAFALSLAEMYSRDYNVFYRYHPYRNTVARKYVAQGNKYLHLSPLVYFNEQGLKERIARSDRLSIIIIDDLEMLRLRRDNTRPFVFAGMKYELDRYEVLGKYHMDGKITPLINEWLSYLSRKMKVPVVGVVTSRPDRHKCKRYQNQKSPGYVPQ